MSFGLCSPCEREGYKERGCKICNRIAVEKRIFMRTVRALIRAGYSISLDNGEDTEISDSRDAAAIEKVAFLTDQDTLNVVKAGKTGSFVYFVYGNSGWDVINDYGVSLEKILKPVNDYADTLCY